jgi:hypothetical protein
MGTTRTPQGSGDSPRALPGRVSDESRATRNADLGSSEATDEAEEERLEILIESDLVVREDL